MVRSLLAQLQLSVGVGAGAHLSPSLKILILALRMVGACLVSSSHPASKSAPHLSCEHVAEDPAVTAASIASPDRPLWKPLCRPQFNSPALPPSNPQAVRGRVPARERDSQEVGTGRYAGAALPDGASQPQARLVSDERHRRRLDGGVERRLDDGERHGQRHAPLASMAASIHLPRYNSEAACESYEAQLGVVARHYGWSPVTIAARLCLALEGKALQALVDLPVEEHGNLEALKATLRQRFGRVPTVQVLRQQLRERRRGKGERLGVLAAELRTLVRQAYPDFAASVWDELALHAFFNVLAPSSLQRHVRLSKVTSLSQVVEEAERAELILKDVQQEPRVEAPSNAGAVRNADTRPASVAPQSQRETSSGPPTEGWGAPESQHPRARTGGGEAGHRTRTLAQVHRTGRAYHSPGGYRLYHVNHPAGCAVPAPRERRCGMGPHRHHAEVSDRGNN
ncbi:hypothetical protein SRHO_G00250360 [Serrasalmus rhombeus]